MATMEPLRCLGIKEAVLSDDGTAVLLELAMANGKIFPLELQAGGVELLLRALFASSQALAEKAPKPAPLRETRIEEAVRVGPAADFLVHPQSGGGARLTLRVGPVDLAVDLSDPAAVAAALQAPSLH